MPPMGKTPPETPVEAAEVVKPRVMLLLLAVNLLGILSSAWVKVKAAPATTLAPPSRGKVPVVAGT